MGWGPYPWEDELSTNLARHLAVPWETSKHCVVKFRLSSVKVPLS